MKNRKYMEDALDSLGDFICGALTHPDTEEVMITHLNFLRVEWEDQDKYIRQLSSVILQAKGLRELYKIEFECEKRIVASLLEDLKSKTAPDSLLNFLDSNRDFLSNMDDHGEEALVWLDKIICPLSPDDLLREGY